MNEIQFEKKGRLRGQNTLERFKMIITLFKTVNATNLDEIELNFDGLVAFLENVPCYS